jgi:hypothetical protein
MAHGRYRYPTIGRPTRIAALFLCLLCAGCATGGTSDTTDAAAAGWTEAPEITYTSDFPVQQDLTEIRAQIQILQHLTTTVDAFPPGVAMTPQVTVWDPDTASERPTDPQLVGSCLLDQKVVDAPHKVMIDYVVHGTTGTTADYLKQIKTVWEQLGWNTGYKAGWEIVQEETDVVQAQTPDHYTLVTQEAFGRREIYVTSPCFPHTGVGGSGALPSEIRHR